MATGALILLNVAAYAVLAYLGSNAMEMDERFWYLFGLSREGFWSGRWWQPLSSMFFHFNFAHLGYNMVFLALFGPKCEELYGTRRFLFIYLGSGLFVSLALILYPPGPGAAGGASGAIFGVLGANLVALRGKYPKGIKTSLIYGFLFFILAEAAGFEAHLGGFAFGFITGYIITRDWYPEGEEEVELDEREVDELEREMGEMKKS
jgi:rhomboid protease GluP